MSFEKSVMPFFSVVIPTYNSEEYIEKTLKSVISQTYTQYEIVVSDDGSEDGTRDLVRSIFKQHPEINFKLLANNHSGAGVARNKGIESAEGEWISFLDSDDRWFPEKLRKVSNYINRNKNIDLVFNNKIYKNGNKERLLNCTEQYDDKLNPFLALYREKFLITSAVTVRRQILKHVGLFDPTLSAGQDFDLWLRISLIKDINLGFIDEPLGFYITREGSISSKYEQRIKCELIISKKYFKQLSKVSKYPNLERLRYEGRLYASVGIGLLRKNILLKGLILSIIGFFKWPFRFDWIIKSIDRIKRGF